jgi:hypothetical protein
MATGSEKGGVYAASAITVSLPPYPGSSRASVFDLAEIVCYKKKCLAIRGE